MSCPFERKKKKSARQTFGGPLCYMKAMELVISPSYGVWWRAACPESRPSSPGRSVDLTAWRSNHTSLLLLLLVAGPLCGPCFSDCLALCACLGTLIGDRVQRSALCLSKPRRDVYRLLQEAAWQKEWESDAKCYFLAQIMNLCNFSMSLRLSSLKTQAQGEMNITQSKRTTQWPRWRLWSTVRGPGSRTSCETSGASYSPSEPRFSLSVKWEYYLSGLLHVNFKESNR